MILEELLDMVLQDKILLLVQFHIMKELEVELEDMGREEQIL